jgi:hypothetical protein
MHRVKLTPQARARALPRRRGRPRKVNYVPTPATPPIYLRLREAKQWYGISVSRLYRLAGRGQITLKKLGSSTIVETASLSAYMAGLPTARIRSSSHD